MIIKRLRCKHCGCEFEAQILSDQEKNEIRRTSRPSRPIQCEKCGSVELQET